MDRSNGFGYFKMILWAAVLVLASTACDMQSEPTRPLKLLRNSGIVVEKDLTTAPAAIAHAKKDWAFRTHSGQLGLWLYEFEGQNEMEAAMSQVQKEWMSAGRAMDFAQNGEFLLVVVPGTHGRELAPDRQDVARIVQAFSGEVER